MPTDIVMPQMGESIFEGTITKWLKKPGDKVQRDEPLFEISTDKVDAEIPAPASGVLQDIKVAEGATVQVNTVVGTISDGDGAAAKPAPAAPSAPAKKEAALVRTAAPVAEPKPVASVSQPEASREEDDHACSFVLRVVLERDPGNQFMFELAQLLQPASHIVHKNHRIFKCPGVIGRYPCPEEFPPQQRRQSSHLHRQPLITPEYAQRPLPVEP